MSLESKKHPPTNRTSIIITDNMKIQIVDKKTGKVIEEETVKNSMGLRGAIRLLYYIDREVDVLQAAWLKLHLFNTSKVKIKDINGVFGGATGYGTYAAVTLIAADSTTDAYTTKYAALNFEPETELNYCEIESTFTPKTKGAGQTLNVTWEIRIGYSTL